MISQEKCNILSPREYFPPAWSVSIMHFGAEQVWQKVVSSQQPIWGQYCPGSDQSQPGISPAPGSACYASVPLLTSASTQPWLRQKGGSREKISWTMCYVQASLSIASTATSYFSRKCIKIYNEGPLLDNFPSSVNCVHFRDFSKVSKRYPVW